MTGLGDFLVKGGTSRLGALFHNFRQDLFLGIEIHFKN